MNPDSPSSKRLEQKYDKLLPTVTFDSMCRLYIMVEQIIATSGCEAGASTRDLLISTCQLLVGYTHQLFGFVGYVERFR